MRLFCILLWVTIIFTEIKYSQCLNDKLQAYFSSDIVKTCNELWSKHKISIEKALEKVMKEYTGSKILNVHLKNLNDTIHVTHGVLVHDGAVDLLLQDLQIRQLPRFLFPQVYLDVPSHVLRLEAALGRVHLDARYEVNKNLTTYKSSENGPVSGSPFSAQEVSPVGQVAIVADNCHFLSLSVLKLNREYVNLGFGTPKLTDCAFSLEIFKPGSNAAPVFAPYFAEEEVNMMQNLISTPIHDKLQPLIQGTLVSYINTSAIFGEHLTNYRQEQEKIFALTSDYMEKSATELNKISAKTQSAPPLSTYQSTGNAVGGHNHPHQKTITLDEISLHGLDSVYSSHSGGPYKLDNIRIGEALRFSALQVRGNLEYKVHEDAYKNSFVSTIKDFSVHLTLNQDGKNARRSFHLGSPYVNYISGFSQLLPENQDPLKDYTKHLLSAHILNTMPEGLQILSQSLSKVFGPVQTDEVEKEADAGSAGDDDQAAADDDDPKEADDGDVEAEDDEGQGAVGDGDLEAEYDDEANGPESLDDVVGANDVESADDGVLVKK